MPLFDYPPSNNSSDNIKSRIQQLRYCILVHSLLYYELDMNVVSDNQWAEWGKELVKLQQAYPQIAQSVVFDEDFRRFDPSTGYDLPYKDEQIVYIAHRLLIAIKDPDIEEHTRAIMLVRTDGNRYERSVPYNARNSSTVKPKPKPAPKIESKPEAKPSAKSNSGSQGVKVKSLFSLS